MQIPISNLLQVFTRLRLALGHEVPQKVHDDRYREDHEEEDVRDPQIRVDRQIVVVDAEGGHVGVHVA